MKEVKTLQQMHRDGRINRRDFLKVMGALGFTAVAANELLTASTVLAASPQRGGTLRQALTGGSSSDRLDPATFLDSYMINVGMGQLRNNLSELDENNQLIPELAESWDTSDGQNWVFNLRKGVEFHNGRSLVANDVVASIQHHLGETKSGAKGIVAQIKEIKADGKSRVVMKLEGPNADFPFLLTDYHLGICPANADGSIDWQSGIGTGGYKLENYDPGVRTLTSRNPNYWKSGRAHFDSVETLFIADTTARENGLVTGELDVITSPNLSTAGRLSSKPGVEVFFTNGRLATTIWLWPSRTLSTDRSGWTRFGSDTLH